MQSFYEPNVLKVKEQYIIIFVSRFVGVALHIDIVPSVNGVMSVATSPHPSVIRSMCVNTADFDGRILAGTGFEVSSWPQGVLSTCWVFGACLCHFGICGAQPSEHPGTRSDHRLASTGHIVNPGKISSPEVV